MNKKNFVILAAVLGVLLAGIVVIIFALGAAEKGRTGNTNTEPPYPVGETPLPEGNYFDDFMCITVNMGEDPETEKNFCWQTFSEKEGGILQYAVCSGEPSSNGITAEEFEKLDIKEKTAVSESDMLMIPADGQYELRGPDLTSRAGYIHRVHLAGLTAGTSYYYRVGDGKGNWSSVASFKTAGENESDFSFLYVTDSQGFTESDFSFWGRLINTAATAHEDFDFILNLGDAVEDGKNQYHWQMFFDAARNVIRNNTFVSVAGNQDKKYTMTHFTFGAEDNRTALVSGYYSFDYGNVHFTVLNTGDGDKDLDKTQLKWLEADLESAEGKEKILLIHKAPYSDANHCNDAEIVAIRKQILPICDTYGVSVVIQGHDHYFIRSTPVYDNAPAKYTTEVVNVDGERTILYKLTEGKGTMYFMNGSAGVKQHSGQIGSNEIIYSDKSSLMNGPTYSYCTVDSEKIVFKTYKVDDEGDRSLVDSWGVCFN